MERKGESKLGNASLVISIISSIGLIIKLSLSYDSFGEDYIFITAVFFGFSTVFFGLLSFCSLGLGLAGIFQKTSNRKYAFIGTTLSVALLLFYIISGIALYV
tara:strand:+ start:151 stop:459 length:309 start_codon:yes stop_codon:yes gene_type:complete